MAGAILIAVVIVVGLPLIFLMVGGAVSALIGWSAKTYAEAEHEGSPYIDLNH